MGDGWGEWVVWLLWGLEGLSETIGWALSFYFVFVILLYISLHAELTYNWIWRQREIPEKRTGRSNKHRSLVVIAHPDDEVMFFGPTIVGLLNKGHVYVLCLCIGDFEEKLVDRTKELYNSCRVLGIKSEHVMVLKHEKMKDGPKRRWPTEHVSKLIAQHVHSHDISTLVTFDNYGVSGHVNHISICKAVMYLQDQNAIPDCRVYILESVNLFRKYAVGLLDLPVAFLSKTFLFVNTGRNRSLVSSAMAKHASQLVWYRQLYMLFSRYVIINSLKEIIPFAEQRRQSIHRKKSD